MLDTAHRHNTPELDRVLVSTGSDPPCNSIIHAFMIHAIALCNLDLGSTSSEEEREKGLTASLFLAFVIWMAHNFTVILFS